MSVSRASSSTGGSLAELRRNVHQAASTCYNRRALEMALYYLQAGGCDDEPRSCDKTIRVARANTVVRALEQLRASQPPRIGLDIGGTMAKMVFMQTSEHQQDAALAERFGTSARRSFSIIGRDRAEYQLHFVSGETLRLQRHLEQLAQNESTQGVARKVTVAGGGAHKFADWTKKGLNVEMVPFQEMESLVNGLQFLYERVPDGGEVYMMAEDDSERPVAWPEPFFPCLLVNIGSGVSILRIDGPGSGYTRIGGTACGGKTFLGLMSRLTSAKTFPEMLELVQRGNADKVNTLVGDIYGEEGCAALGLPASLTAAYFGKLKHGSSENDCAAALLMLVVQESVLLSRVFSLLIGTQTGHPPPVFFVGGFLADNTPAQRIISKTYRNLNIGPALFLRHADFLGALGCLRHSLDEDMGDLKATSIRE